MSKAQDPFVIRGNTVKNRIVMEPMRTFSFHGDNGSFYGKQHIEHYSACAKGGAGLIIVEATLVAGASDKTHMWTEADTNALGQIAANSHAHGAVVMMQLACGDALVNEMTVQEIHSMQKDMLEAAVTANEMGYDGVEYHFAHGTTLCKFLDAAHNRRNDMYGGSAAGRAFVLTEILPAIRERTRPSFMVGVRMGAYQPALKDGLEAAEAFEKAGLDLLNISSGMVRSEEPGPDGFTSLTTYSGYEIKKHSSIPVIVVKNIREEAQIRFLLQNEYADLIGIGRGFLADPEFGNHVLRGEAVNPCFSCGECFWFTDHTQCPARAVLHG